MIKDHELDGGWERVGGVGSLHNDEDCWRYRDGLLQPTAVIAKGI